MNSITLKTLIAAGLFLCALEGRSETLLIQGDAIEVEDGDTLQVTFADGIKRIQLTGIDAPEDRENPKFAVDRQRTGLDDKTLMSLGIIATGYLNMLIAADEMYELRYEGENPDKYGRLPGELLTRSGNSINRRMVADGYAIALPGGAATLLSLQQQAAVTRKGLWKMLAKPTRLWAGADPVH